MEKKILCSTRKINLCEIKLVLDNSDSILITIIIITIIIIITTILLCAMADNVR